MLKTWLADVQKDELKARYLQRRTLCIDLGGTEVDQLTITNPDAPRRFKKAPPIFDLCRLEFDFGVRCLGLTR